LFVDYFVEENRVKISSVEEARAKAVEKEIKASFPQIACELQVTPSPKR
jgi:hypothetical protein